MKTHWFLPNKMRTKVKVTSREGDFRTIEKLIWWTKIMSEKNHKHNCKEDKNYDDCKFKQDECKRIPTPV
ncbi:hypothetical protein QUF86_26790 [Peribacillus sp. NJ11]|uniref:hypothetical protein n=1 Tax=Peribacillus sp. NJ11 TaxID=3055861 RepID=UPI0025A13AC8|nr:hypothetical protein [Peribacillus sp. NJ11]MDM5224284.1 hypothetical protein [Peribacillus sp. NJ11]